MASPAPLRSGEEAGPDSAARDPVAPILLAAAVAVASGAAKWLEVQSRTLGDRTPSAAGFAGFGACLALSFWAGRRRARREELPAEVAPAPSVSGARALAAIALGVAAILLFGITWSLQRDQRHVPLAALATWSASLIAAGLAFAAASRPVRVVDSGRPRRFGAAAGALLLLIAAGSYMRLAGLARSPAVFGGDEANQTEDALALLTHRSSVDLFGPGWYGAMRIGMLPAGIGALASDDPIAGPRFPYALAGAMSLAAAAAAGWLVAGAWGAFGAAALLAVAPHHLHFSRIASHMILDSLAAGLFLALVLGTRKTRSAPMAFATGAVAGLAMYGYSSGRILPILLLFAAPFLILSSRFRGRRGILALALAAGFLFAALPNLRAAYRDFDDWNSRWNQTGIFRPDWWEPSVARLGSGPAVLAEQIVAGTVGLLFRHSLSPWYTRYPIAGPALPLALGAAGLGWLFGRRRYFAAALLAMLVCGNFASLVLTDATPTPQRPSSLFLALAILGGAAIAAFVGLTRGLTPAKARWSALAGAALLTAVLFEDPRELPPWNDPAPRYGGDHAAFVLSASRLLPRPPGSRAPVYLDGMPHVHSTFPLFPYLLPSTHVIDVDLAQLGDRRPPSGWHLVGPEWMTTAATWRERFGITRIVTLPDPRDPMRDIGYLIRVP